MLLEALEYALTPAPDWARRSGLLHGSIAVNGRYRRHKRAWRSHLDNTRSAILAAADLCARKHTAIILGSGALYDVPLASLCDHFERVVLVDAVHPWRARRRAKRHGAQLVHLDLSGVYDALLLGVANGADTAPNPHIAPIPNVERDTVDLVVSVNLMSQLPLGPVEFMHRHNVLTPEDEAHFARAILHAHLAFITEFPATICLITDRTRETRDRDGAVLRASDALYDIKLPPADREWVWNIAPLGEISRHKAIHNHVQASFTPQS